MRCRRIPRQDDQIRARFLARHLFFLAGESAGRTQKCARSESNFSRCSLFSLCHVERERNISDHLCALEAENSQRSFAALRMTMDKARRGRFALTGDCFTRAPISKPRFGGGLESAPPW